MNFLSPAAAAVAAAIAIPALVSLYFLKLKRRRVEIASTLLWKKAVKDMEVNSPFQKLRRNLLLLVQLLLLAALLVAMARPVLDEPAKPGQLVVIAVDHSASMNAVDAAGGEGVTRLEEAKRRARERVDQLSRGEGAQAMVVSYAGAARIRQPRTTDAAALRAAIDAIEPTDQPTTLRGAVELVAPFAQQAEAEGGAPVRLHLFTDGQSGEKARGAAGGISHAEVLYERVGGGDDPIDNLAIVAFAVRRDFERPQVAEMFARLANYGGTRVEASLSLELDGKLIRVEPVSVAPAGEAGPGSAAIEMSFRLAGSGVVSIYHDHDDDLAADDRAWLNVAPSRRLRVLMVSTGNAFLERGLRAAGVRDLVTMPPEKYENQPAEALVRQPGANVSPAEAGFDVIVFDGYAPRGLPPVSSLSFAAAPPIAGLERIGPKAEDPETQPVLDWERTHPLLRFVAMDDVLLAGPGRLVVPDRGEVLMTAQAGPVMASVTVDGRRHVAASFDVLNTNWPLFVSFPVFLTNAVETLGLGRFADSAAVGYRPEETAMVPAPGLAGANAASLRFVGPTTLEADATPGGVVTPVIPRVGLYRARGSGADAVPPPFDRLAVSLLNEAESDIRVREEVAVAAGGGVAAAGTVEGGYREVWPYFAMGALVLLMLEWLLYTRRMHL